ncbi:dolichyl-phosphate-mannose--protein mannosyltransferase [Leptospira gomenensis]|uniref:Dolichyl-phosphate-mannose--protein mannosyltransferase n=1 Tax=Leptospira gomenensis TaxID=2484974 RepID=A0A5F1YDX6_9LEPT|nr:glycosyltransferase family 39 protein [Leptospira gomenensis]TGK35502.1 dolichyl-phosphate-mannose--protein mannosyltransferase [Leptospira gomenensis]TGK40606.1 dolichyl-phosphate-mannose--protein mannosyltransferase [Leptospira gomenensis]TGK46284.1 dolichyl-phosphate-mannose--protein mannosyltransferase [Leptospira gomenensis]TGK66419.1 dolichyl-phosphate-mannose--protein mannosyltransferase [Leptospira gomenensis]
MSRIKSFFSKHQDLLLIGFVLALGIFVRLFRLDLQSPWEDELFSIRASSETSLEKLWDWMKNDPHPPLYQTLLYFWFQLFGATVFWGRLFSAIAGMFVPIVFLYFTPKELPDRIRIVTAALLSFSPGLIYYSQELRSYSLLVLFCTILFAFTLRIVYARDESERSFLLWKLTAVALLASYTHFFGFLWAASTFLGLFLTEWIAEKKFPKREFLCGTVLAVSFLPAVYMLFSSDKMKTASWIPEAGIIVFIVFFDRIFHSGFLNKFVPGLLASAALVVGFATQYYGKGKEKNGFEELEFSHKKSIRLISVVFLVFAVVIGVLSIKQPILTDRNLLVAAPAIYFLVVTAFSRFSVYRGNRLKTLLIGISLVSLYYYSRHYYKPFKEQWRESSQFIISTIRETPSEYTVYCSSHSYNLEYFLKTAGIVTIAPGIYSKEEADRFVSDSKRRKLVILETSWKHLDSDELKASFPQNRFDREDRLFYGMRVVLIRKK